MRYIGYLLMVVAVLALAGTTAVFLFGGLSEQFRVPGSVRLIALDEAATPQTQQLHVGAKLDDFDYGRPMVSCYMVIRYDDGPCAAYYTDSTGLLRWIRRGPLPAGRHAYTVMFPETHSRADVRAQATVWIFPAGVRALWVDAAALVPETRPGETHSLPQAKAMRPALEILKTLATGRQVVYLVAADIAEYQAVREQLDKAAATPGPVIWLRKGNELERLRVLADGWRDVDGAVVAAPAVADAVAKLKIRVVRLPRAGEVAAQEPPKTGAVRGTGEGT